MLLCTNSLLTLLGEHPRYVGHRHVCWTLENGSQVTPAWHGRSLEIVLYAWYFIFPFVVIFTVLGLVFRVTQLDQIVLLTE